MKLSESYWQEYIQATRNETIPDLSKLGLPVGESKTRYLFQTPGSMRAQEAVHFLTACFENEFKIESKDLSDERKVIELSRKLFKAAEGADIEYCREALEGGFPINFQNPRNRETLLHQATRLAIHIPENLTNDMIEMLLSFSPDLLIQDKNGKLPMHNVVFYGVKEPTAEKICQLTREAALQEGVDLKNDYKEHYASWLEKGIVGATLALDDYT